MIYKKTIIIIPIIITLTILLLLTKIDNNDRITGYEETNDLPVVSEDFDMLSNMLSEEGNRRNYGGFLDFPYLDMPFANNEIFDLYKIAYGNIDFYGEFLKGDEMVQSFYKDKYHQLLKNERDFIDPKTGERFFLDEFATIKEDAIAGIYNLSNYTYYFFDIDGDNMPELGISSDLTNNCAYVFKYDFVFDEFVLWYDLSPYYQLLGSKKMTWIHLGTGIGIAFYKLDGNGEEEYSAFWYSTSMHNENNEKPEEIFIVGLVRYADKDKQIELPEKIKNEAYSDSYGTLYFRFTRNQYDELTKSYWEALRKAEEDLHEISFTYEELFADVSH